jgi:hypothetical protein
MHVRRAPIALAGLNQIDQMVPIVYVPKPIPATPSA